MMKQPTTLKVERNVWVPDDAPHTFRSVVDAFRFAFRTLEPKHAFHWGWIAGMWSAAGLAFILKTLSYAG